VQYDAWVRINAAFCRAYGWTGESVACHKETSVEGKVDPRGPVEGYGTRGKFAFSPSQFRKDVAERLRHPASWSPGVVKPPAPKPPAPKPTPVPSVEDRLASLEKRVTALEKG
jgi:hypothetical protein